MNHSSTQAQIMKHTSFLHFLAVSSELITLTSMKNNMPTCKASEIQKSELLFTSCRSRSSADSNHRSSGRRGGQRCWSSWGWAPRRWHRCSPPPRSSPPSPPATAAPGRESASRESLFLMPARSASSARRPRRRRGWGPWKAAAPTCSPRDLSWEREPNSSKLHHSPSIEARALLRDCMQCNSRW